MHTTDVLIIGGGSAGFGAAYRALQHENCRVTLIEQNPGLGGTSTYGGVNCWEPGYGGAGVHHLLARMLMESGNGFVGKTVSFLSETQPWTVSEKCEDPYSESLIRGFRDIHAQRRFQFEPDALQDAMLQLLQTAARPGQLSLHLNTQVTAIKTHGRKIVEVTAKSSEGMMVFHPHTVVDCTGDIHIARWAGCAYRVGEDACTDYDEPHAPENPQRLINGLSLIFRVTPCEQGHVDEIPAAYLLPATDPWLENLHEHSLPICVFNKYPNGDINVNMLPTLPGDLALDLPEADVYRLALCRVYAYWHFLQTQKGMQGYRISHIFPMMGVRQSYRLVGKYVLREQDLRRGFAQVGAHRTIARADHPADFHGRTNTTGNMNMFDPYGIPYDCLLPNEVSNLLVACRGSSFSHIAASSARLSRTMMALGEAAGEAAAQCIEKDILPEKVDVAAIRKALGFA